MKKTLILLLLTTIISLAQAGNPSKDNNSTLNSVLITGRIIDKNTGEEIIGAEITINDKVLYSDINGNFSALIDVKFPEAIVKYISYKDTKTKINPFSFNSIEIEMDSK